MQIGLRPAGGRGGRGVPGARALPALRRFSLMELLVVLAIISILSALLLPGLRNALEESRKVACANNLQKLFQCGMVYADDNNGFWPPHGMGGYDWYFWMFGYDPKTGIGISKWLSRISVSPQIVRCPADETSQDVSYMCNAVTSPNVVPGVVLDINIRLQGNRISRRYPGAGRIGVIPWLVDRTRILGGYSTGANVQAGTALRHINTANIVFFDGHTRSYYEPIIWDVLFNDRNKWK